MKKTIIALMALASVAMGTEYEGSFAWSASSSPTLTFADELNCPLSFELTTSENFKSTTFQSGTFTPDSNVGNGDDWTLNFSVNNNGEEAITLTGITLGVFSFTSGGVSQGANTNRSIILTLSGDVTGVTNHTTSGGTGTNGSLADVALTLDDSVTIGAGESISFALNVKRNDMLGTFVGLKSANVTTAIVVPEPTTATLSLLALAGLAARRRRK